MSFSERPRVLWPAVALVRFAGWCLNRLLTSAFAVTVQRRLAKPDTATWRWETDPLPPSPKVCVFVTYSPDGRIPKRAVHHAALWRDQGYAVLFVLAMKDYACHPQIPFGHAICRQNVGHDFAAWGRALSEIDLTQTSIVATVNDSVFASGKLADAIVRAEHSDAAIVAFTENREYRWHVQSYAVIFKRACFTSEAFARFWTPRNGSRRHVILTYEIPMARDMQRAGHKIDVLFPLPYYRNPTHYHWQLLAEMGFPFIKRSSLPSMYAAWQPMFARYGFDQTTIDRERP